MIRYVFIEQLQNFSKDVQRRTVGRSLGAEDPPFCLVVPF